MSHYKFLFYCIYCFTGKNESVFIRVSALLAIAASFLLITILLYIQVLVVRYLSSSFLSFIVIMSVFIGSFALHLIYFLGKGRGERIVEHYEHQVNKRAAKLIGFGFLFGSIALLIVTFYLLGPSTLRLIEK
jgi:hypothetical protein